jgi:hypothetical protein
MKAMANVVLPECFQNRFVTWSAAKTSDDVEIFEQALPTVAELSLLFGHDWG